LAALVTFDTTEVFFVVEDVFLAALTAATADFSAPDTLLATLVTVVFTLEATAATAPATAPTTPAAAAFLTVVVEVVFVLLFLLPDELLELPDDEDEEDEEEELLDPSYFAHCFIVSFTLQLIHVPLGAIVVSLTDASVSMS